MIFQDPSSSLNPVFTIGEQIEPKSVMHRTIDDDVGQTPYTLTLMSWVALAFVPLILAYQAWSYWVFRRRISVKNIPASPTEPPVYVDGPGRDSSGSDSSQDGSRVPS